MTMQYVRTEFAPDGRASVLFTTETGENFRIGRVPGSDVSDLPQEAQTEIGAAWTQQVIDDWNAAVAASAPPEGEPSPPRPVLVGAELISVSGGELTGFENAIGFGFAVDTGDYYLFFAHDFGEARYSYAVFADNGYRAEVMERNGSYMRVTAHDATGDPADPTEISVLMYRTI